MCCSGCFKDATETGVVYMTNKECSHRFVATGDKGEWKVSVKSTNNRGNPDDEFVITSVFECKDCGSLIEYPDEWESNYIAPVNAGEIIKPSKKRTARKSKVKNKRSSA